jgi:hypothetical protein
MPRISFALLLAVTLMGAGCGYSSRNYMNGNGIPNITQLTPSSVLAGGTDFDVTVVGTGFGTDSMVYWGGMIRASTYADSNHVKASITAADIMNAGMVQIYVHSGGANSNSMTFTIQ